MKRMKNALMAICAILMGTTFTSCLNSENGSSWDSSANVTTKSYLGGVVLLTDDGFTLVPSNPDLLQYKDGTYAKRCELAFKWNEGVVFDKDVEKRYGITIVQVGYVYPVRDFCNLTDTIKHDYPISEVTQFWGANAEYLTVSWKFNVTDTSEKIGFELYPEEVDNDVLIMRLRQSLGSEGGYNTYSYFTSFTMPTLSEINDILGTELQSTNDSISVKIAIKKSSNSEDLSTTKALKVKVNY